MILYVDETENERLFIVAGILVNSKTEIESAYKLFKNSICGVRVSHKTKAKIYTEFKSTLIDRTYQRIKCNMLTELCRTDARILFSSYKKEKTVMNQLQKESVYLHLLLSVLSELAESTDVVFDGFGKPDFEEKIVSESSLFTNVRSIQPGDSQLEHGLQFADNVCSTIRLYENGEDTLGYYDIVKFHTARIASFDAIDVF